MSTLNSCDTDKDSLPSPKPQPVIVSDIDFRYDVSPKEVQEYEFILSQKDGKVLLDTILTSQADHSLRVESTDTLFDVTTVIFNPNSDNYYIKTYRQINPDDWYLRELSSSKKWGESERSTVVYNNLPSYDRELLFMTLEPGFWLSEFVGNTLSVEFDRLLPVDTAYLLLPSLGKYLFTNLNSKHTNIDFSAAANTVKRKFNKPAGISKFKPYLKGFLKAGNYDKELWLYMPLSYPSEDYDLQFPPTGIEEFELTMGYLAADKSSHNYYYRGPSIPTDIELLPKADFTVTKEGDDGFTITFEEEKPTFYRAYGNFTLDGTTSRWSIYSPVTQTNLAPQAFLTSLKSKMMEGKALSEVTVSFVSSYKFEGYTYQTYHDYLANPAELAKRQMKQSRVVSKSVEDL
ncbi:hypothetical protein [Pontibacter mangrovi]|uniref:Uncharacterized protein n=1 Tax=Pontibacter mangrovi TaxID=2589816 RepID=A0A501WBT2_9BACT|nr:hypothetical protein [Pontibacter mangrovi]TPE42956.1 hypothetical protein FJM65_15000 [Pontibacter mangrovi]